MKFSHVILYDLSVSLGNLIVYFMTGNKGNVIAATILLSFGIIMILVEIIR